MMNPTMLRFSCLLALFAFVVIHAAKPSARLRGKHFAELEQMARNPVIDAAIRGKTLKELGIREQNNHKFDYQSRRKAQTADDDEVVTLNYFTVYDEYDATELVTLGQTAGSRGMVYSPQAREDGLQEEFIEGALQGTCSLVTSDGKQLCSYEFFFLNPTTETLGTIVATGTVRMEVDSNGILVVEATGDDFAGYKGGMVIVKYTHIDDVQTVMDITLQLKKR